MFLIRVELGISHLVDLGEGTGGNGGQHGEDHESNKDRIWDWGSVAIYRTGSGYSFVPRELCSFSPDN